MLEILQFIFHDFWIFCGVVVLLYVIGVYWITAPISAIATAIAGSQSGKKQEKKEEDSF